MNKFFLVILLLFIISFCTKVPKEFIAPQVKLKISDNKDLKVYKILVEAALNNENQFTAFLNLKGKVDLLSKNRKEIIEEINFDLPELLPFAVSRFKFEKEISLAVMTKIMKEFNLDENLLKSSTVIDDTNIEDNNIILKELNFEKKDIIKLLEGRSNEKN